MTLLDAAYKAIELINKPRNEGIFEARAVLAEAINEAEGRAGVGDDMGSFYDSAGKFSGDFVAALPDDRPAVAVDAVRLASVVARMKGEILFDVAAGIHPATVAGFSDLHDHVDANGYGGAFEVAGDFDETEQEFWNAAQGAIDEWIKAGGLR